MKEKKILFGVSSYREYVGEVIRGAHLQKWGFINSDLPVNRLSRKMNVSSMEMLES